MAPFSHYDESTSKLLFEAFDAAWREVEVTNAGSHGATKARLTRGLLSAAATGERDPIKLKLAALNGE
jgi:hypothetical protein